MSADFVRCRSQGGWVALQEHIIVAICLLELDGLN